MTERFSAMLIGVGSTHCSRCRRALLAQHAETETQLDYCLLRRCHAAAPAPPEAKSRRLPGSGVEPLELEEPRIVKDSDGIAPSWFSEACDGQPGEVQP